MSHQKTEVVSKSNKLTFLRTVDLECCIGWVEYHSWLSYFAIIFGNAHFQCYYTAIFLFSYSIVSRPVTLACGHSGYKNCMETWAESTATPLCPQCRATFRKEELRINVAMDKATQDLPVKCNSQPASGRATIAMPTITSKIAQKYERGAPTKDTSTWRHGKKWQQMLTQKKGSHVQDANWV